jgi:multiple sugar transport system ATP-binding protein
MTVAPPSAQLKADLKKIGDTMTAEWMKTAGADGQAVVYGVRPDHLELGGDAQRGVPGEIIVVEPTGSETELVVKIGDAQMIVETHGRPALQPGDKVTFAVKPANVHLFDRSSGARLA